MGPLRLSGARRYTPGTGASRMWPWKKLKANSSVPQQATFDLAQLRQDLTQRVDRDLYEGEVEPLLREWEAKYGNDVPAEELQNLQQLAARKRSALEADRQAMIDQQAKEERTIELAALRNRMQHAKDDYVGPDREAYSLAIDALLKDLGEKYGDSIPVDDAYRLMKEWDPD